MLLDVSSSTSHLLSVFENGGIKTPTYLPLHALRHVILRITALSFNIHVFADHLNIAIQNKRNVYYRTHTSRHDVSDRQQEHSNSISNYTTFIIASLQRPGILDFSSSSGSSKCLQIRVLAGR